MIIKFPAARGGTFLAGVLAISLLASGPVTAVDNGDVAPAQGAAFQTSQKGSNRVRETPAGTPDRSPWNKRYDTAERHTAEEPSLPALGKPMPLLGGLFQSFPARASPHPD